MLKGSKAKEIIRPIFAKPDEAAGETEPRMLGFKAVRCIFTLSETEGDELPPLQMPEWDADTALANLNVRRVPFTELNGNVQGYSRLREIAINPLARNPAKTLMHDLGHIVLGHTLSMETYLEHRGVKEFQAEATAYLAMNELQQMDEETATISRGYVQHWLDDERPPDRAIREVFTATDQILKAGRMVVGATVE